MAERLEYFGVGRSCVQRSFSCTIVPSHLLKMYGRSNSTARRAQFLIVTVLFGHVSGKSRGVLLCEHSISLSLYSSWPHWRSSLTTLNPRIPPRATQEGLMQRCAALLMAVGLGHATVVPAAAHCCGRSIARHQEKRAWWRFGPREAGHRRRLLRESRCNRSFTWVTFSCGNCSRVPEAV